MPGTTILARFRDRPIRSSISGKRRRSARKKRLGLERLEDRILLADVSWTNGMGGSWQTGSNWSTGAVPQPSDRALITLDGTYTVALDGDVTIAGLTLGGNTGTQTLNTGTRTLTINGPGSVTPDGFLLFGGGKIDGTGTLTNRGTVECHMGNSLTSIDVPFENATPGSVLRFGADLSGNLLHFAQGFTNHGLIESTNFNFDQVPGPTSSLTIGSGEETLVNAPDGTIHIVPGSHGGLRQFHLTLDNQGTVTLDNPLELFVGRFGGSGITSAATNSGTITADGASLTISLSDPSSFTNTGTMDIGSDQTLSVRIVNGGASEFTQAGTISGPGTVDLSNVVANFVTDFSNAETSLTAPGFVTINGPGTLHFVRDQTIGEVSVVNAAIVNDAILTLDRVNVNGPFTANPGSTLRVKFSTTFANGFTNHGIIELTSDFGSALTVSNGTLVNAPDGIIRSLSGTGASVPVIATNGFGNGGIDNQGLIEVKEVSLKITCAGLDSLTTSGTVRISEGQTLTFTCPLEIAAGAVISADGPAFLNVAGISSDSQDPNTLANLAVTSFGSDFFNTDAFEAMSEDRGPVNAGFDSNFALRQLATGPGDIKLVDNADNAPGTGPEAVYADSVVIRPFSRVVDLNGLHLYTRALSLGAGVTNGTIQIVNDGGPISLDRLVPGNIGAADERDEWTFFGRAGQTVTVVVTTGGSDPDAPLAPQIGFAQVALTDATGASLGSATNAVQDEDVTILNIELPTDGVYSIFVSNAPGHAANNANYQVGAFDATAEEARIVFNQPYLGQIPNRFAVDRWTFSGVAGQTVRLDVLDQADPPVQFALRGPSGSVFESVTADTIAALPEDGAYELIVGAAQPASYRFQIDEVNPTELTLGTPFVGTLPAGGFAQLFRVPVSATQALSISLDAASTEGHNELYVKIGSPPTRSDYQFASFTPGAVDQSVLVPAAAPGDWFILVYGEAVPEPAGFTLLARGADVFVNSLAPDRLASSVAVDECDTPAPVEFVIEGTGFRDVTSVEFVTSTGFVVGSADVINVDSSRRLRATVFPHQVPEPIQMPDLDSFTYLASPNDDPGPFSARVTNQDGSVGLLESAISLGPSLTLHEIGDVFSGVCSANLRQGTGFLDVNLIIPSVLYPTGVTTLTVEYENRGLLPTPSPILVVRLEDPFQLYPDLKPIMTLDPSIVTTGFLTSATTPDGFSDTIQVLASGRIPGVLEPGERGQVPVYLVGFSGQLPFHAPLQFVVRLISQDSNNFFVVDWQSSKDNLRPDGIDSEAWDAIFENYETRVGQSPGDYVELLDSNAAYFSRIGENVTDVGKLNGFTLALADGLHPVHTLETTTDATVPAPGLDLELTRTFPNTISTRYRRGVLGRGWYHSWETSLTVEPDGTVIVVTPNGVQRNFEPDRRLGRQANYFATLGDHGALTRLADGSFDLSEANGLLQHYGSDGKLDFVEDLNGNRITETYTGNLLTRLDHSSGQFLDLAYNAAGLLETVTDSDGRVVRYSYNAANEHLVQFEDFDGRITRYTYTDGTDVQQNHALATIEPPSGVTRHFIYNDQGRYASTFLNDGDERIDFTFGPAGEVTATDLTGAAYTFFMDRFGGVARVDDALGNSISGGFSNERNLTRFTDAIGQIFSFGYDTRGNVTSAVDPLGHSYRFSYGAFNRLRTFTDSKGNVTQYVSDARGNRTATTDAIGASDQVTYDPLGNPTSFTNRRGHVIASTFNSDGLLTSKSYEDGTSVTYGYDDRGRLVSTVDPSGTTTFEYDAGDRLTRVTYPGPRFLEYTYDTAGRRTRMVDQDGFTVNYLYNAVGRLSELQDSSGATIVKYSYDSVGRLSRRENGNGTFSTYDYDADGQLLHLINHAPDGSVNSRFDYTYDALGRRSSMSTLDGAWTYEYDVIGQLTHAVFDSVNPDIPDQDLAYEYDAMGNRVRTIENGVETNYTTNALNQFTQVGSATYAYDADGNLISIVDGTTTTTYTFDDEGRLVAASADGSTTSYEYNALNHRIATVVDGTRTEFLNDPTGIVNLVAEFNGSGAVRAHYTHGLGLTSRVDASATAAFYDFDAIGSTVGVTGAAGTYLNQYGYLPFGKSVGVTESVANPFQYVGRLGVTQEANGLAYMRSRFYSVIDGSFISDDPIGLKGGLNLRRYVGNDPISHVDPSGLLARSILELQIDLLVTYINDERPDRTADALITSDIILLALFFIGGTFSDILLATVVAPFIVGEGIGTFLNQIIVDPIFFGICDLAGCFDPDPDIFGADFGAAGFKAFVTSLDPNSKTAAAGFGDTHFVSADTVLPYRIDFENDAAATAPAQRVDVADQLSDKLDWNTFQFTEVAFGDQFIAIPPGSQFFHTVVDVNASSGGGGADFQVAIDLDFNSATGQVTAQFQSIDPATGLPPSALAGFLPPEDGTGRGQGHFSYIIRPAAGLATGTEIRNIAIIQFDFGEIIATNQVDPHDPTQGTDPAKEALVTIDAGVPTSTVNPLPAITHTTSFPVSWSGSDDADGAPGSGIAFFDVFVSDNNGPFTAFQTAATATSATFTGAIGHTYSFFSVATDAVGHVQPTPAGGQAMTTLMDPGPRVTDVRINADSSRKSIANIVLSFSQALAPATANNPASFMIHTAGKDKRPGTADDVMLPVATAVYDDALRTVTLTPQTAKPLKLNQILRVTAKGVGGVTNARGTALDGDANNAPGGDFIRDLGLGTKLNYIDANGDTVSLSLKRGGLLELIVPSTGDPTLRLSGTVAGASTLTGSVKKPKTGGGDGRTNLAAITGSVGVNRAGLPICSAQVPSNCFNFASISAVVVDRLLSEEGLSASSI